MASIKDVNQRARATLEGEKQFKHAMRSNSVRALLYGRFGFDVWQMPVCEKCEGYAMWDKDGVGTCVGCGHTTKNPITVQEYYEQGCHIDRTVKPDASIYLDREKVEAKNICTIHAGDAGISGDPHKQILIARS